MNIKIQSNSPEATLAEGARLGTLLCGDELLLISGPLGAGKTLFVKGIARSRGIDPAEVVSPTFVLMNQYQGRESFFHFDLYRLGMEGRVADPGVDEYLGCGIVVVEWAQFLAPDLFSAEAVIAIDIQPRADDTRTIGIQTSLPALARFFPPGGAVC